MIFMHLFWDAVLRVYQHLMLEQIHKIKFFKKNKNLSIKDNR